MQSLLKSINFVIQLHLIPMNICKSLIIILAAAFSNFEIVAAVDVDALAASADSEPKNMSLNLKAGKALYNAGSYGKARKYFERAGNEALPWIAKLDFDSYRFDQAEERAQKYLDSKHDESSESHAVAEGVINQVELARAMLDRVEKVIVIDSIVVGKDDFFKAYRISAPSGRVTDSSVLPDGFTAATPTSVYVSENGENMLWGASDADGHVTIMETTHLADGSWEKSHEVSDNLQLGGNANFPFLMSDGMTLYYASDGEGGLGGYDIYVTRNDGDRYLNPQNIGMPYNSPLDDYLLAIDDATGVGWWATDRNMIPDSVTIYVFIPQELRDNYPVDGTPDLVDRARITSVAATHKEGIDYSRYLNAIKNISVSKGTGKNSNGKFAFALPDGRVITSFDRFKSAAAADLMRDYIDAKQEFESRQKALLELRRAYAEGNRTVADEIRGEEKQLEQFRGRLRTMANGIVKAEMGR